MRTPRRALRAAVVDARGRPVSVPGLASWLSRVAPARARGELTIALVSDARMRAINRAFRRRDAVTDVLSFPEDAAFPPAKPGHRSAVNRAGVRKSLGEIVIARGAARRQAHGAGHSELAELRILALHGLLHLMGYDHHNDNGTMARLESRLRRKGGLREGLIERAHRQ